MGMWRTPAMSYKDTHSQDPAILSLLRRVIRVLSRRRLGYGARSGSQRWITTWRDCAKLVMVARW